MKWITAANLEQWAETLQARTVFPALVADLIRASAPEISSIRFPSGDKGQVRGFDGFLEAAGVSPYVPDGNSIWEFGVTGDVIGKADGDYKKRTEEVDAIVRANTTFVFATPRTWDRPRKKIADWLKQKRDLGEWKGVEYIDGIAIEDWLIAHPAVASRYSKYELNQMPQLGAYSTDEFWDEYSSRFVRGLVEDVLLAGRESQETNLLQKLMGGSGTMPYAADSPDEVIAFAVAAIRRADPPVRLYLEARTLIVDSEDAARQLSNRDGLIFLPRGQARGFAGWLARRGPTLVSAGADDLRGSHELLARPSASAFGKAIESMGHSTEQAYEIARKCGRSLAVLARQIPSGTAEQPEWIQHSNALLPAMLAGAWKVTSSADKEILKVIGDSKDYESVEAPLRALTKLKDPPVDHVGDVWAMRASVDAFVNLAHLLGEEHLSRFATAATEVFSKIAPIPKPEEVFRPSSNREDSHSNWLREGLMTTLLHMAVLHEQAGFTVQGTTPQRYVDSIVRNLPGLASDYRLMASLRDNLALLAEAAPNPFLEALERLLEGDAAAIKPIFEEQKGFVTSHSYHVGVLWALETLAWDPDYLLRAATCLARLAAIDPGGSTSNRPINSLRAIFLTWSPNTRANMKQRLGVLTHVVRTVPSITWALLLKLLPQHYDSSSSTAKPKFRESDGASNEVLTYGVVWESQATIISLALKEAGADPEKWEKLVGVMGQFQAEPFDQTFVALDKFFGTQTTDARFRVWDALRKEANRHRAFSNADWAFNGEILARVDALVEKYQPADPLLIISWLFDDWMPDVPQKADFTGDPMEAVEPLRIKALQDIYEIKGLVGIIALAKSVKLPQLVAATLSKLELPLSQMAEFLREAIVAGQTVESLAVRMIADGITRFGDQWINEIRTIIADLGLEPIRVSRLFLGMPETRTSWELVSSFGESVDSLYWEEKHAFSISGKVEDLLYAVEQYRSHGRPMAAIEALFQRLGEVPSRLLLLLLDEAIPQINTSRDAGRTMTAYYIEQIFEEFEKRTDITPEEVAQREFAYLPIFVHRKEPLTLHRLMVENPEIFMSAICAVFKPASTEAPEVSPEAERLASAAYELLGSLHVLPGQHEGNVELETLGKWCAEVRQLAEEKDRKTVTDSRLGHLLAYAPASLVDHAWPHESVRVVIEELASDDLEKGIVVERFNMRGVYSKALGEGGQQEHALAKQAREWAAAMPDHPRTSAMLMRISDSWEREAHAADVQAEKEALRW